MVTPINANMNAVRGALPTKASTTGRKVCLVHDSQMIVTQDRIGAGVAVWPVPYVGRLVGMKQQSVPGLFFDDETGAGASVRSVDWGSGTAWSNGDDTVQQGWGVEVPFTADVANFYDLFTFALTTTGGNYTDPYDVSTRWRMGMAIYDAPDSPNRCNLVEYRRNTSGDVYGIGKRFGSGGTDVDIDGNPITFSGAGAIHICDMEVRAPGVGLFGDPADEPSTRLGLRAEAVSSVETGDSHKFVFFFGHESPSGKDFPSTGLFMASCGDESLSAHDHTQQAQAVKDAMVKAAGGYDLLIIMLGHNNDASGTHAGNTETLIGQWNTAHDNNSVARPKYLLVAPWVAPTASSWTEAKVDALHELAVAGGHGFISLWHSYGGVNPDQRTKRLDGTSVLYQMDGNDLHSGNQATAEAIAMDLWWHFQPANWVPDQPARGPRTGRRRARRRGRSSGGGVWPKRM